MKPSVGRIVHHVHTGGACWAALVTQVSADGSVTLTVFPPGSPPVAIKTPEWMDEAHAVGSWHWPERVEE